MPSLENQSHFAVSYPGFPCYESNNCSGPGDHIAYTKRDCCVWTTYGHSYDNNGVPEGCASCMGIELL